MACKLSDGIARVILENAAAVDEFLSLLFADASLTTVVVVTDLKLHVVGTQTAPITRQLEIG